MQIRRAQVKDIPAIMKQLNQVLEIHASIRPDIFIPGTTKYTVEELTTIINDDQKAVFVAVDEDDQVLGYAFTQLQEQPFSTNMVQFKSLFIDDLCVDSTQRSQGVGRALLDYVKAEAKRLGCYEVTLNVWEGNDSAINFYKKNGLKVKGTNMEFIL
ncbi:N-acetyltransferase family protein [Lactobacillus delbrueckii]|uniref:GNAT family N-acetyltransferase n=1 Tax=Lactobacillus delbrueckii TaxID=1584 RepID=UPI0039946809